MSRIGPAGAPRGATSVDLLGSFALRQGAARIELPLTAQRLLAFLALRGGVLKRNYVAGVLWIDQNQDAANANLRTTLWRLKRAHCQLVDSTPTHLSLAPDVAVDLRHVTAMTERIGTGASECALDAIMVAGEVLPDWYDDWVVIERERFRQTRLHALETIGVSLIDAGRYDKAIDAGLSAVTGEPLRESAHRLVMRAHLAEGNPSEALRQYELCRGLLSDQLGFEPCAETRRLREQCFTGDAVVTSVR